MCFANVSDDIRSWRKEKLFLEDLFYIYKEFAVSGKAGFKDKDDLEKKIREKVVNRVSVLLDTSQEYYFILGKAKYHF